MHRITACGIIAGMTLLIAGGAAHAQDCSGPIGARSQEDDNQSCWSRVAMITSSDAARWGWALEAAHTTVITSDGDARLGVTTFVEFSYWRHEDGRLLRCRDIFREDGTRLTGTGSACYEAGTSE